MCCTGPAIGSDESAFTRHHGQRRASLTWRRDARRWPTRGGWACRREPCGQQAQLVRLHIPLTSPAIARLAEEAVRDAIVQRIDGLEANDAVR